MRVRCRGYDPHLSQLFAPIQTCGGLLEPENNLFYKKIESIINIEHCCVETVIILFIPKINFIRL